VSPLARNRKFESISLQRGSGESLANLKTTSTFRCGVARPSNRAAVGDLRAPMRRHPARRGASTSDQGAPAEVYAFPATTFVEPARSHYTRIQLKTLCASAT